MIPLSLGDIKNEEIKNTAILLQHKQYFKLYEFEITRDGCIYFCLFHFQLSSLAQSSLYHLSQTEHVWKRNTTRSTQRRAPPLEYDKTLFVFISQKEVFSASPQQRYMSASPFFFFFLFLFSRKLSSLARSILHHFIGKTAFVTFSNFVTFATFFNFCHFFAMTTSAFNTTWN